VTFHALFVLTLEKTLVGCAERRIAEEEPWT
jgi:hypothetical protein